MKRNKVKKGKYIQAFKGTSSQNHMHGSTSDRKKYLFQEIVISKQQIVKSFMDASIWVIYF